MARNASGVYTLPLPAVVTQEIIESTWANTTTQDLRTEMTDSLSRSGKGSMLAGLPLFDGTRALPGLTFGTELDTGLYRAASQDIRLSISDSDVIRWLSDGADVLTTENSAGTITASTTQTQGQQPLTSSLNIITTVANANDTVTLPSVEAGLRCRIINDGANTLQIFPASGDDLGEGADVAEALVAGASRSYMGTSTTDWDSNSEFFNGLEVNGTLNMAVGGSPRLRNASGSSASPNIIPNNSDATTGVSGNGSGELYLISGGILQANITTTGIIATATTQSVSPTTGALTSEGGLGIVKDVFIGGDILVKSTANITRKNSLCNSIGGIGIQVNLNTGSSFIQQLDDLGVAEFTWVAFSRGGGVILHAQGVNRIEASGVGATITGICTMNQPAANAIINFSGAAGANTTDPISTHNTSGTITDHIQIQLNGAKAWIAVSTNDPSA